MNPEWFAVFGALLIAIGAVWLFVRNTDSDGRAALLMVSTILLLVVCIFGVAMAVNRKSCRLFGEVNRWTHQFTIINGCLLEVEPGRWIPREAVYSQVEDLR